MMSSRRRLRWLFTLAVASCLLVFEPVCTPALVSLRPQESSPADELFRKADHQAKLGRLTEAATGFREAAELAARLRQPDRQVRALKQLVITYSLQGLTPEAHDAFKAATALDRLSPSDTAQLNQILGDLFNDMGQFPEAREQYRLGLSVCAPSSLLERAFLYSHISVAFAREKEFAAAARFGRVAVDLAFRSHEPRAPEAQVYSLLSMVEARSVPNTPSDSEANKRDLERALGLAPRVSDESVAFIYSSISEDQLRGGHYPEALESIDKAIAIYRKSHLFGDYAGDALKGRAKILAKMGRFDEATLAIDEARQTVEILRTKSQSSKVRASYFEWKQDSARIAIDILMQRSAIEKNSAFEHRAFIESEWNKGRTLLDEIGSARERVETSVNDALLKEEAAAQRAVGDLLKKEQAEIASNRYAENYQAEQRRKYWLALEALDEVRAKIMRMRRSKAPAPLDLLQIQELVDPGTLFLEYALGEERSVLWIVGRTSVSSVELASEYSINSAEETLRRLLTVPERERRGSWHTATKELSRLILGPAANLLGKKRLAIIPEGALHLVPFAELTDPWCIDRVDDSAPCGPLLDRHEVVVLPSASIIKALRERSENRSVPPNLVALFADGVFGPEDPRLQKHFGVGTGQGSKSAAAERNSGGTHRGLQIGTLPRLTSTRTEAKQILHLVPRDKALAAFGFEANREALESLDLSHYRILHLATHAAASLRFPELSGITLSRWDERGNQINGDLRAYEIQEMKIPVDLVVLSACETGSGKLVRGEGVMSLTRSFLRAGATRVLATLWSVDDRATEQLMARFYRGVIQERLSYAQALRKAQESMSRDPKWGDPYYWAGFELQGDWK